MNINYKNLFYIFHPDGKFTEEQLRKILDAAYAEGHKKGYNEGYEVGKNSSFHIGYPYNDWWTEPYYKITCNNKTGDAVVPTVTTTADINPPSVTTTANTTEYINNNFNGTKSQNPYGMEFKYYGTEK